MGQMTAEQTVQIIEATSEAIKTPVENGTNYWWLLIIAMIGIIPAMISIYIRRKK